MIGTIRTRLAKAEFAVAARRSVDRLAKYRADPALLMADAGVPADPWQAELLRSDPRRALLLCARQVGKSTSCAFLALRFALLDVGTTVAIVSPSLRQSSEMLRKVAGGLTSLGHPVAATGDSASKLELANGSRVLSLPATESTIRGLSAGLVIADEAARIPDTLLAAVRPMLAATGGRFVALSSAFAKSGWFYDLWTSGDDWQRVSVAASSCPRIAPEFLVEERKVLGPRWFSMEYENEFQDDAAAVFSGEDIRAALAADVAPLFGGSA